MDRTFRRDFFPGFDIVADVMSAAAFPANSEPGPTPLTRNQIRGFWASWGGWALDGMDSFIYALVLVPSLRELLPRSGIAATKGNIGFYGGLLFALFLVGWGLAFLWGPVGDKFGRVRTLMLTIVWYSVFTFLSAIVTGVWQLAILRLLAGIGIGGEWAMGGTFVAEEWPEEKRLAGAGYLHTGYYVGTFLAAALNFLIGSYFGASAWRVMFAVGGLPALFDWELHPMASAALSRPAASEDHVIRPRPYSRINGIRSFSSRRSSSFTSRRRSRDW